jgi:hypothetical protein
VTGLEADMCSNPAFDGTFGLGQSAVFQDPSTCHPARTVGLSISHGRVWDDSVMPKKPKKSATEPEHFQLAHELAEDAIGGLLFQPKRIRIRRPKPLLHRKKVTTKKARRRPTKK